MLPPDPCIHKLCRYVWSRAGMASCGRRMAKPMRVELATSHSHAAHMRRAPHARAVCMALRNVHNQLSSPANHCSRPHNAGGHRYSSCSSARPGGMAARHATRSLLSTLAQRSPQPPAPLRLVRHLPAASCQRSVVRVLPLNQPAATEAEAEGALAACISKVARGWLVSGGEHHPATLLMHHQPLHVRLVDVVLGNDVPARTATGACCTQRIRMHGHDPQHACVPRWSLPSHRLLGTLPRCAPWRAERRQRHGCHASTYSRMPVKIASQCSWLAGIQQRGLHRSAAAPDSRQSAQCASHLSALRSANATPSAACLSEMSDCTCRAAATA